MATLYETLNRVALFLSLPARAMRACGGQLLPDGRGGLTAALPFSRPDPGLGGNAAPRAAAFRKPQPDPADSSNPLAHPFTPLPPNWPGVALKPLAREGGGKRCRSTAFWIAWDKPV